MPTINENIAELQQKTTDLITAHTDIKNAIIAKGGTVNDGDKFSDYPEDIATIKNELTSISINENGTYYGGAETTVTSSTFPIVVSDSNGTPIRHVDINGNTVQSGTPTPSSPITPSETGDLTGNLCNPTPYKLNYYINENGVETQYNGFDIYKVTATAQTEYTLSLNTSLSGSTVRIHSYSNDSWVEQIAAPTVRTLPITFTTPQDCDEIRFSITRNALNHIMLNLGSTPLPYENFGYKISISSSVNNLFDVNDVIPGYQTNTGDILTISSSSWCTSNYIPISPNQTYTFNPNSNAGNVAYHCAFDYERNFLQAFESGLSTMQMPANAAFLRVTYRISDSHDIMLNEGSTALPYEPYTTIPVYLSEVQSTRQIKKLVFSSSQNWQLQSINSHGIANFYIVITNDFLDKSLVISNYFTPQTTPIADTTTEGILIAVSTTVSIYIRINSQTASTVQEFKNWLDGLSEEAAFWYVLAEPTTGIVNEPLMKIDSYADSLSVDVELPLPQNAKNNIDVNTTLKPSSASISYYKLGVNKTITSDTLPIEFESNGDPLTSYSITGQTVQNGTPTPSSIVDVNGTGDRTGNLFDLTSYASYTVSDITITSDSISFTAAASYLAIRYFFPLSPTDIFTINLGSNSKKVRLELRYRKNGSTVGDAIVVTIGNSYVIRGSNDVDEIHINISNGTNSGTCTASNIMLNEGSTALPYEPYGIKIPISSASTTTPVYLGEVESTRRIKKLVLTGQETWNKELSVMFFITSVSMPLTQYGESFCSHYTSQPSYDDVRANNFTFGVSRRPALFIHDERFTTTDELRAYLQQQYAAGTPVTVWYVLAEPTTGIVNEPLMRIGDYADTLSSVQAQVQIPTTVGHNTFNVNTTIKPSSTSITYNDLNTIGYNEINVDVPNTYTVEDEGKVVNNATLVAQTAMPTEITANDTYDTTLYNSIVVNVPAEPSPSPTPHVDQVRFLDYDGTVLHTYTPTEFANLSAMPANPTHTGLTSQGWNWTLNDAKTYVAENKNLDIGQMYITSDGKTRIYITLTEGRISPILQLYLATNSELDIDWGDGSTHSTFTSTSAGYKGEIHNYSTPGDYVISITVTTGSFVLQSSASASLSSILWNGNNNTNSPDRAYNNAIKKIEIGTGVGSIGNNAFTSCSSLSSITIPNTVTSIGNSAFNTCYSLSSITIPDTVTSIGNQAFYYCTSLQSITIPNGVTSIGDSAFQNCYALTSVTIPDGVTSIGGNAFYYCYSLSSVTIGDSVTSIGEGVFYQCFSLSSITIPDTVTNIGSYAFYSCYSLSSITLPDGVTTIGQSAFYSCYSLSSITIPDGVTTIGQNAFYSCYSLSSVTIGNSVTSIDVSVFNGCYSLSSITIPDTVTSIGQQAFMNCKSLQSISIPDSVTSISQYVFASCFSLSSITIPDTVTNIGSNAFQYCTSLQSITIPDGVTRLDVSAFTGCYALTSITIPDTVTSIDQGTFQKCYSLSSVTIGDSVTSIGGSAFQGCTYLESIKFKPTTPPTVSNSNAWSGVPTSCTMLVPINTFAAYTTKTNYPSSSTYTYLVFGTYESGESLPSTSTDNYILTWYASIADAKAQTNPITTGNGNEVYARCVAI